MFWRVFWMIFYFYFFSSVCSFLHCSCQLLSIVALLAARFGKWKIDFSHKIYIDVDFIASGRYHFDILLFWTTNCVCVRAFVCVDRAHVFQIFFWVRSYNLESNFAQMINGQFDRNVILLQPFRFFFVHIHNWNQVNHVCLSAAFSSISGNGIHMSFVSMRRLYRYMHMRCRNICFFSCLHLWFTNSFSSHICIAVSLPHKHIYCGISNVVVH